MPAFIAWVSTPSNSSMKLLQRVVALRAAVVDQVESDLDMLLPSRAIGMILYACTIAESSPALTHSSRNTEFSTMRAAGLRPKEMFDRPSVVCTPGCSALQLADGLDGGDAVLAGLLLAGADREGQRVDEDVAIAHPQCRSGRR